MGRTWIQIITITINLLQKEIATLSLSPSKEIQYNIDMKVVTIKHEHIFNIVSDMMYDFIYLDGETVESWMFLIEDLTTPEKFVEAVTTNHKAFTYLSSLDDGSSCDLDQLQDHYNTTKEDFVIVVTKNNKPWASVLFSQLNW